MTTNDKQTKYVYNTKSFYLNLLSLLDHSYFRDIGKQATFNFW